MSASTKKTASFRALKGVVAPTGVNRPGFLSDVIVDLGFATRETVDQAVREARSPGTTVARVLVDIGAIDEEQLARATAERYCIDYVDLSGFDVDPTAANLIKPAAARRYQAVPVGHVGKSLLVAMADPADALGLNDIAAMTKLDVRPAVASRPALDELLEALPLDEDGWEPHPEAEAVEPEDEHEAAAPDVEPEAAEPEDEVEAAAGKPRRARPGAAFAVRAEDLLAQVSGLRHERDDLRLELRRVSAEVEVRISELEALRAKLTDAETELVRARAVADAHADELAAADARSEQARQALAEMREEAEREREQAAMTERELREKLGGEGRRRGELEGRLADVESAAFAAERSFEELRLAQQRMRSALRALAEPDAPHGGVGA
jgi:Type II secretion system (T2SS), protein E, N-terminal domain